MPTLEYDNYLANHPDFLSAEDKENLLKGAIKCEIPYAEKYWDAEQKRFRPSKVNGVYEPTYVLRYYTDTEVALEALGEYSYYVFRERNHVIESIIRAWGDMFLLDLIQSGKEE